MKQQVERHERDEKERREIEKYRLKKVCIEKEAFECAIDEHEEEK